MTGVQTCALPISHDAVTLTLTAIITELIDLPAVSAGTDPDSQMIRIQADAAFKF